jgi:cytochrome c553
MALYPVISGQHATYAASALRAYASGERANAMMQEIAARMSDEDIAAVSAYIQGLR